MRTETEILADVMDILARDLWSADGIAGAAIMDAAQRLRERMHEAIRAEIRPLEWRTDSDGDWVAETEIGDYHVFSGDAVWYGELWNGPGPSALRTSAEISTSDDADTCKLACEEWHRRFVTRLLTAGGER
jgi:hypothetical protein